MRIRPWKIINEEKPQGRVLRTGSMPSPECFFIGLICQYICEEEKLLPYGGRQRRTRSLTGVHFVSLGWDLGFSIEMAKSVLDQEQQSREILERWELGFFYRMRTRLAILSIDMSDSPPHEAISTWTYHRKPSLLSIIVRVGESHQLEMGGGYPYHVLSPSLACMPRSGRRHAVAEAKMTGEMGRDRWWTDTVTSSRFDL